jgi:hypothetical protein
MTIETSSMDALTQEIFLSPDPVEEVSELFNPENSKISLTSFLKEMKFQKYPDAKIWEQARIQYPIWRDENAYVAIARLTQDSEPPSNLSLILEWVPQKRRGSDIYCTAVWAKFQPLLKAVRVDPQRFSPASFLTLTSDAKRGTEWNLETIEKGWNHMLTLIRQRVGRTVEFLKVVELTEKGHAHIHAILFNVPFVSKAWLSSTWNRLHHAYIVDIQAVRNIEYSIDYLLKHQQKVLRDEDAQAYFWFHRKRSWTTSRGLWKLVESVVDLTKDYLIQSNEHLIHCCRLKSVALSPGSVVISLLRLTQDGSTRM